MDGVLVLAHGSKRKETESTLNSLVLKVKEKTGLKLVYPAYLQFSEQNLEAGIYWLVKNGAKNVRVIPLFLFEGVHVTTDIPHELKEIQTRYPDVSFRMGSIIGDDDRLAEIVADRIRATL